jgi:hypothetical protein
VVPSGKSSVNRHLRYLDAAKVACPGGSLSTLAVESGSGEVLGHVDGVLIDPAARRVRYYVVAVANWHRARRYLVSGDQPTYLETDRQVLRLPIDRRALQQCPEFRVTDVAPFSADDAIEAMFAAAS